MSDARRIPIWIFVVLSVLGAGFAADARPFDLFDREGLENAQSLLAGLLSPDLSAEFLSRIARLAVESLEIGVLASALGVVLALALAIVATALPDLPDARRSIAVRATRSMARLILGFLRAIPDIIWAFLFVRLVGLGPLPAILAIGLGTAGAVGKMFAELAESVDPAPVRALRAAGVGPIGIYFHGVLPQVRRPWIAYSLFRLECALRSATILGVVGAGGLGTEIALSVQYLEFDKLATALLAVLACVAGIEIVGDQLRKRRALLTLGLGAAATVITLGFVDLGSVHLGDAGRSLRFFGGLGAATQILSTGLKLGLETVAMAWVSTILAAFVAFFGAALATRSLLGGSYLPDPVGRGGLLGLIPPLARIVLQITRCVPDLALALLFVVWVGPGPFAGVLAIGVHTIGVLGRLYSDVYEDVESKAPAALEQSGAGVLGRWLHGVLPQVGPRLAAFTLYRFEINIRHTAMVGFVGAGGIGNALHTAISLFHMGDLLILLAIMVALVSLLDALGDRARRHLLMAHKTPREVRPYQVFSLGRLRSLT